MQTSSNSSTQRKKSSGSSSSHASTSRSTRSRSHSRSASRQLSLAAVAVAEPFDPSKERTEIEALTSAISLPDDSIHPVPAASSSPSRISTPRLRFETFATKLDYRHDGDRFMDTDAMIAKRRKLKQDDSVTSWINVFWRTFHHAEIEQQKRDRKAADDSSAAQHAAPPASPPSAPVAEDDDPFTERTASPAPSAPASASAAASSSPPVSAMLAGSIDRGQYMSVHKLWFKALHRLYDRSDARAQAIKDWARDSWLSSCSSSAALDHVAFTDALFELVDIWTLTVESSEYAHFLATLYHRVTRVKSWLGDDGSIITKYVWRKTKYVKPSAVYRPYQYHRYKDVQWKAASEVLHHLDSDDSSDEDGEGGDDDREEDEDDAMIRDLHALTDDELPSSPSSTSSSLSSDESDSPSPRQPSPSAHSVLSSRSSAPDPASFTPASASPPAASKKTAVAALPPLNIDPDKVLRSLSDVDVQPPMSPFLDPPAFIPLTPVPGGGQETGEEGSSDDDEDAEERRRRRLERRTRMSLLAQQAASSSSEPDDDELSLLSPSVSSSLHHAHHRYVTAIDALEQQRQDRYLLLVSNLKTMLDNTRRHLTRPTSAIQFSSSGQPTRDVEPQLQEAHHELDDWAARSGGEPAPGRRRRWSRTEPIGCLVDDDDRYLQLRGDGRRRNSCPADVAVFCCTGPMVYAEEAAPSGSVSMDGGRLRRPPTLDELEGGDSDADNSASGAQSSRRQPQQEEAARPGSSEMAQEDFTAYIASLTQQATAIPASAQPTAEEQSAAPQPAAATDRLQLPSTPLVPEQLHSMPYSVASPAAASPAPPPAQSAAVRPSAVQEMRPPSPIFAQAKPRPTSNPADSKPAAKKPPKERKERPHDRKRAASTVKAKAAAEAAPAPAAGGELTAVVEVAMVREVEKVEDEVQEEEEAAPSDELKADSRPHMGDVVSRVVNGHRGTVRAAQKMVEARDRRLADLDGARIRDEALAAEYDEDALNRGSDVRAAHSRGLKQRQELEEASRASTAASASSDTAASQEDRLQETHRRKREAEEKRKREEEARRKRKEEEERKAQEDRQAAAAAEKELFALLHEAESQRKMEKQLKQQKQELLSKEKESRRQKERQDREKEKEQQRQREQAAERAAEDDSAHSGGSEQQPAAIARQREEPSGSRAAQAAKAERRPSVADGAKKGSRAEGARASMEKLPATMEGEERDEQDAQVAGSTVEAAAEEKQGEEKGKDTARVKKATAAERKARLAEEQRQRAAALKQRAQQEAAAAAQRSAKAGKKVLKARSLARAEPNDGGPATLQPEPDEDGGVKIRPDFLKARTIDRTEDEEEAAGQDAADSRDAAGQDNRWKAKGKGWTEERKGKDSVPVSGPPLAETQDEAAKQKAGKEKKATAPTASRKTKETGTEPQQGAGGRKAEAKKATTNRQSGRRAKAEAAGDEAADSVGPPDQSSVRSKGGALTAETRTRSEVDTGSTEAASSSDGAASSSVSAGRRAKKAARARKTAAQAEAEDAALLAAEAEKYGFGADWTQEQKRAFRDAEYAKEKKEEAAALKASGEDGLVELKWAVKTQDIKRKEERVRKLEEKESRMREIEQAKKERQRAKEEQQAERQKERQQRLQKQEKERKTQQEEGEAVKASKQRIPKPEQETQELPAASSTGGRKEEKQAAATRRKLAAEALKTPKSSRAAAPSQPRRPKPAASKAERLKSEQPEDGAEDENDSHQPQQQAEETVETEEDRTAEAAHSFSSSSDIAEADAVSVAPSRLRRSVQSSPRVGKAEVQASEPEVVEALPLSSFPSSSAAAARVETDPRKLAAQKRREEAQRRIEEMKRQRSSQILSQQERRASQSSQAEEAEEEAEIRSSSSLSPSHLSEAAAHHGGQIAPDRASGPQTLEEAKAAAEAAALQPRDDEIKYWAQQLIGDSRPPEQQEVEVRVLEDAAAVPSEAEAIQRELQMLRNPRRGWGLGLSKEDGVLTAEQQTAPLAQSGQDEELAGWQDRPPPRPQSGAGGASEAQRLAAPDPNGPLSARAIPTPRKNLPLQPDPLVRETAADAHPAASSRLSYAANAATVPGSYLLSAAPDAPLLAAPLAIHPVAPFCLPAPPHPSASAVAEAAARREHRREEQRGQLQSLLEHSDEGISEANARRWLLMEELSEELKRGSERWQRRRAEVEERREAERGAERRRLEAEEAGWNAQRRGLEGQSEQLRRERKEAREARRRQSEQRKEERQREAEQLRVMREDILHQKVERRRRRQEQQQAVAAERVRLRRRREEESEARRREEEDRVIAERERQEQERQEAEFRREQECRRREEEKAEEEERVRQQQEETRAEEQRQHKEEKQRRKAEKEERKREETRRRVLEALQEVERQAAARAEQRRRDEETRELRRQEAEERQRREVREQRLRLHDELRLWWQLKQQERLRVEKEHRRQVMEEEEKRREEVEVLRSHRQRAQSSPASASAAPTPSAYRAGGRLGRCDDAEEAAVRRAAVSGLELSKVERLRLEMSARRSMDRLMTKQAFLRLRAASGSRENAEGAAQPLFLPPLHPAPAFTGEEEKVAVVLSSRSQRADSSPSSPSSSSRPVADARLLQERDIAYRLRRHRLMVQGNPSLHSGNSWRVPLKGERLLAISPILPPAMQKRVRERAEGAAMALPLGREAKEVRRGEGTRMWGSSGEEMELVGRRQRAFKRRQSRRCSVAQQQQTARSQQPQADMRDEDAHEVLAEAVEQREEAENVQEQAASDAESAMQDEQASSVEAAADDTQAAVDERSREDAAAADDDDVDALLAASEQPAAAVEMPTVE